MSTPPLGALAPQVGDVPGPRSRELSARLAAVESPAFEARREAREARSGEEQGAIVYAEAHGDNVRDVDGNVFVDLTAGFGALALGHTPEVLSAALSRELGRLPLALGDVYAAESKVLACERIAQLFPEPGARVMLGSSGADAVTAALKTVELHGRAGLVAFRGAYHGLSHGPLAACGLSPAFREPFAGSLSKNVQFAPFPESAAELDGALGEVRRLLASGAIGGVLVEPLLGRGGCVEPPAAFLPELRRLCDEAGALLVVDEIWTGLGRSGAWLASAPVVPDVLCLGKALGGGFPISACVGRREVMAAWGAHGGTLIHTATHFGSPLSAVAALTTLEQIVERQLPARALRVGEVLMGKLRAAGFAAQGRGLMVGVRVGPGALGIARRLLRAGYIVLTGGTAGDVLTLSPALTVDEALLDGFVGALAATQ